MPLAFATLLATTARDATADYVEAIVAGERCWIRFGQATRDAARADIFAEHEASLRAIHALGLATNADTRVVLNVRLDLAPISPGIYEGSLWFCPNPARRAAAQPIAHTAAQARCRLGAQEDHASEACV